MADYKIKLGIDFNDSELKNIKKQLTNLTDNTHRVKIDIDNSRLLKQIEHAKKELKELNSAKGNQPSLTVNTQSLEKSLSRVADVIGEVRNALGTLDDKSGMKSLLSSVNQIATALGKVENESDSLLKSLSALSKKDFSVNFRINLGKSNSVANNQAYGNYVRQELYPELKRQEQAITNYLAQYYKTNPFNALDKLYKSSGRTGGLQNIIMMLSDLETPFKKAENLSFRISQFQDFFRDINEMTRAQGIDLSPITSQFDKQADQMVKTAYDIKDGANQAEESFEKLKQVIGGGSLDVEGLSGQLQPIITDLGEIKTAIQSLSSNNSIDGLTQSFNRLSETLEKLTANLTLAKNTLDTGFSGAPNISSGAIDNIEKISDSSTAAIVQSEERKQQAIKQIDDVVDEQVLKLMNKYAIVGDKGSNAFEEIRQALVKCGNELNIIKNSDIGIDEEVFDTSRAIDNVTEAIANQHRAASELGTEYVKLAQYVSNFGGKVHIPDFIKQEQGDDYKSYRGSLGAAFTTGKGQDFADFITELNASEEVGQMIDLTKGEAEAFEELVHKVKLGRQQIKELSKSDNYRASTASTEEILEQNGINKEEIYDDVMSIISVMDTAEQKISQSSTEMASEVAQSGEKIEQSYRETSGVIENLKTTLETMRVDRSSIDAVIKDMEELGFTATDTSVKMKNGGFDITVKGTDSIGRAITEIRHLDNATGEISLVDRKITQSLTETDRFVKQQKQAVSNLTNQINQLNRSAIDQNASRPIKDTAHLDALADKYDEITLAIQRMENASSDTFVDEQNNVKKLISDYKSLVSEFKNAENVSNKMKGTDFASGLDIAKNDLEKFKAQAKDFPQITDTIEDLDRAIEGVGDAASLNKFNDQLRVARSELAKVKSETTALNRSEKVGINVSGLGSKIADLQRISPEIDKFETEIDGAKVSVQSLLGDLKQVNTQNDFSVVNSKWKSFTDAAKAAGIAVTETAMKARTALANDIKLDIELGNVDNEMGTMRSKFDNLSDASDELRISVEQVENAYKELNLAANANTGDEVADRERLIQAEEKYAAALQKTNNLIKQQARQDSIAQANEKLANSHKSLELDMVNWLKKNSKAAKDYGEQIEELILQLNRLEQAGNLKQVDINSARSSFNLLTKDAESRGKTGLTAWDKLVSKVKEYSMYLSAADIFMYASQGLKDMFEQVKLIDSAMTELKKVTDETDASYDKFLTNAASRAKEIGTTIDGLVSSTADFARLGYDFVDAQGLAEVANIYAVVGDDIDSVETATQNLISTLTAFKNEAGDLSDSDFALSIVDKMNEVKFDAS